jgi:hypothetical protein
MPPDHSTLSRTRRLIDVETHQAVFRRVLELLAEKNLLKGKTIGVDATTLEANAALRSIVRRDTGEGYQVLVRLAKESGIATPTREQLAKLDRKRAGKGSNGEWVNPHDPDARIRKMKDGRTHLAHKAEHAVDLETGAVVVVTVAAGDTGDTTTILETLPQAGEHIAEVACATNHEDVGERVHPQGPVEAGRQRLSQQRHTAGAPGSRSSDLHLGAGPWTAELEGQTGSAASGVRQPAAHSRRAWKRAVATARGVAGTQFRTCL